MLIGSLQTFFGFIFLAVFQVSFAETRLDLNYVNSWGEASDLQEKFGSQVIVQHNVSVTEDGFQAAYVSLTPRGRKIIGRAILIHGFDRDSKYWVETDFLKASQLLEQGYRVLLPDLMVRGRTKELNFALDEKKRWNPNEQQQRWLQRLSGHQEARYQAALLKNDQANDGKNLPLIIAGHSYGALVAAYLTYQLAQENKWAEKKKQPLPWDIKALWSLSGFLVYTTSSTQFGLDSKKRDQILEGYEKLLEIQPELQLLQGQDIQPGDTAKIQAAEIVEKTVGPLMQNYLRSYEGLGENSFVNLVMGGFEEELERHGSSRFLQRHVYNREQELTAAMMNGLRTVYRVNVSNGGLQNSSTKNIMIPDSIFGIYRLLMKGTLPGVHALHLVVGKKDSIIPLKMAKFVNVISPTKISYQFHEFNIGHFSPEESEVRDLFRSELIAPSCQAILN